MWTDLQPMGLHAAARRLDLTPFELVRLLVATDGVPADLMFHEEQLEALREKGGLEPSWWEGVALPEDVNPRRQRVRAALTLLMERGHVGGEGTRLDNLWRGLPLEEQELIHAAVLALADEGLVLLIPTKLCTRVTVSPSGADRVRQIAEGRADTSALSAVYGA